MVPVQAEGWPALAPPNLPGPMLGGNFFAGSSSSPQPGTGMAPPTLPANGALPGDIPRYEGQLVSHIMQVQALKLPRSGTCAFLLSLVSLGSISDIYYSQTSGSVQGCAVAKNAVFTEAKLEKGMC